jgi:hypothetical protein
MHLLTRFAGPTTAAGSETETPTTVRVRTRRVSVPRKQDTPHTPPNDPQLATSATGEISASADDGERLPVRA